MAEGVLLFNVAEEIIKKLGSLAAQEVALWCGVKDQLRKLEGTRKQLVYGNKVSGKVRVFFSKSNQFVYGLGMGHEVKALRERLADIDADSKRFNFEVHHEEKAPLTTVREQTNSSEHEVIVGREGDKVALKTFLLNSNNEQNVSVISIVGIGGLGKTTLAQHAFNDEQVKEHFGLKLWVSVSGGLDAKKILKDILQAIPKKDSNLEAAGVRGDSD
ncbi:unnamed protein product, partial [Dovyalis caffra]